MGTHYGLARFFIIVVSSVEVSSVSITKGFSESSGFITAAAGLRGSTARTLSGGSEVTVRDNHSGVTARQQSQTSVRMSDCGGFIEVSPDSSGVIQSPGYPGNYPNYTRCVWILETPFLYTPKLVVNFVGEMYENACSDYVEFRDGGPQDSIILINCNEMKSQVVRSTGQWMFVLFKSDGFSQVDGLQATYTAEFVGSEINSSIPNPVSACRTFQFQCSNRLCVSMSYICDGYNDCGCWTDCDEDGCNGLPISKSLRLTIGFTVGISVFLLSAGFGLLWDNYQLMNGNKMLEMIVKAPPTLFQYLQKKHRGH